jgi:hypothetical protein
MSYPLLQSTASQKVYVYLVDSTDHVTAKTGVTSPTVTVSKNGGSLGAAHDGTWAELAGGMYTVQLDATDTATVGPLVVRVVKADCDDARVLCYVRANVEPSEDDVKAILSLAKGKVTRSGNAFTFYAEDGVTDLFTLTYTTSERTVS